jgi:hypothetical protein
MIAFRLTKPRIWEYKTQMEDVMPESLYAAAGKVAELAGVNTYAGTQIYRGLQASGALPVSAGRRVWSATPDLIASYIIGLACDEEMACFDPIAAALEGAAHTGRRTFKSTLAGYIAAPALAATVDRIEIRRDDAIAAVFMRDGSRIEFEPDADNKPPSGEPTWMRRAAVIPGAMLVRIAEDIDFDRAAGPRQATDGVLGGA